MIAVGTSVTRALEGSARRPGNGGRVQAERAITDLVLGTGTERRVVEGLLTGVHDQGSSHFALLGAFMDSEIHAHAAEYSSKNEYLGHEFGDGWLVL